MCIWVSVGAAVVTVVCTTISATVSGVQNQKAAAMAEKQYKAQRNFEEKQLKLQKNDKVRQDILQRNQLRKQRAQVMTSVSLNNVMADRANLESTKVRRENAVAGAGLDAKRTSMPTSMPTTRTSYAYGNAK